VVVTWSIRHSVRGFRTECRIHQAAGTRHTARGWKLIATKRIGKAGAWSWYATDICSLNVTQLKPEPSTGAPSDSITVSLLWGPAIGCLGPYTKHWRP